MKQRIGIFSFTGAIAVLVFLNFSCGKSGSDPSPSSSVKDSILVNIGTNIIVPGYQALAGSVNSLDSAILNFNAGPNNTKLTNVQTLFKTAYINWVSVSQFNYLGPAADIQPPLAGLDNFPAGTDTIEVNITRNPATVNINSYTNRSAKGFAALDYLLFSNNATVAAYTTDANAANRKQYLATVSADIKTEINNVLNGWLGSYNNTFMAGTGTSVSSSLGLVINSLDQEVDILKNYRVGVPLGAILVDTIGKANPTQVEAYYSGISAQLVLTQVKAMQGLYLGTGAKGNGLGLTNYLTQSSKTFSGYTGTSLDNEIKAQFTLVIADMQSVPDPLSATIQNNATPVTKALTDIQHLLLLLKTDMPSLLGIAITYGDNDGD